MTDLYVGEVWRPMLDLPPGAGTPSTATAIGPDGRERPAEVEADAGRLPRRGRADRSGRVAARRPNVAQEDGRADRVGKPGAAMTEPSTRASTGPTGRLGDGRRGERLREQAAMTDRACPVCGESLERRRRQTRTCSGKCRAEWSRQRRLLAGAEVDGFGSDKNLPGVGPMRAAGYVRVSTIEQQRHGWNLGEDRERILERADAEGWELVELFDDGGRQGDDLERPGLQALLASVEAGAVEVVILRDLDRLSRDRYIYALAVRTFDLAGVAVYEFDKPEAVTFDLATDVRAAVAQDEKRKIGVRVKLARAGRERAGLVPGGTAPYGLRWQEKRLVQVPEQAAVVRRIFTDYASGMGQRAIVRAFAAEGIRSATGAPWHQSGVSRVLAQPLYAGRLRNGEDAEHEAIVGAELWERVQATRASASRRKGGRQADGGHLLVRGTLRGVCGAAMLPRKARPGVERERYVCAGRIADPDSCSQPSIRRECIDAPFLATLLDGYIDLDATRQRIAERAQSALVDGRQAAEQAEAELGRADARLAKVERGWQDEVIDDAEYARQRADLEAQREAASAALERAQEHVEHVEQVGVPGDVEQVVLDHLAALKRAVASGFGEAPNLEARRNVIGDLFAEVQLVRSHTFPGPGVNDGVIPWHHDTPVVDDEDGQQRYWLLLVLRASAVDAGTAKPIGQAMPVPVAQSYPPGFLARYCW
jgi:site-specific DNA recombinase